MSYKTGYKIKGFFEYIAPCLQKMEVKDGYKAPN